MTSAANRRYPTIQGEFEVELEDEFDTPRAGAEFEDEAEYDAEFEDEDEAEYDAEFEDEGEGEEFLGGLARAVGGLLGGGGDPEAEVEFDFEAEAETEDEGEFELEDEGEAFVNPVRRIYPDAELMAHLSARAAQAESESESEAFVGALIPIASRLVPRAAKLLNRHAPSLIRGASQLSRRLRRNPATRRYITAIPVILQRTAQSLADQAAAGRPVTPDVVVSTLSRIAAQVLRTPARRARATRAVRSFDRRYHRRTRPASRRGRPTAARGGSRSGVRTRARRRR